MQPILSRLLRNDFDCENRPSEAMPEVSKEAYSLLVNVNYHPFTGLVARYTSLGLSTRKATLAKDELVEKGLVEEVNIRLSIRRPTKFLVPTNLSLNILKMNRQNTDLWNVVGRQGFEHKLYSVLIFYAYKKSGCQAYLEKTIEDHRTDVYVVSGTETIAVEVQLGEIDLEEKSELLDHVDRLQFVVKEEDLDKAISILKSLPSGVKDKVEVHSIVQFLRKLSSNYIEEVNGNNPSGQNKSFPDSIPRNKSETFGA